MDTLSNGTTLTNSQKEDLIEKVKQEIALANFQEILSVIINYLQ
jgi:hypothetical protein